MQDSLAMRDRDQTVIGRTVGRMGRRCGSVTGIGEDGGVTARQRTSHGLASRVVFLIAALALVPIVGVVWSAASRGEFGSTLTNVLAMTSYAVAMVAFVLSGALIVSRQPRNVIGWLLMIPGLTLPISELATQWLIAMDPPPQSADPWLWLALWFISWSWVLLIFPLFHLLLIFPNGRFLSPRWQWVGWLEGTMVAIMVGLATIGDPLTLDVEEETLWTVPNPIGFLTNSQFVESFFGVVWTPLLLLITVASVAAFVVRFRTGSYEERHQLKWPLGAVALFGVVYGATALASSFTTGGLADLVFGLSLAGLPVAVAIAVLRYRLYEIDRIISRTVSYAVVVAFLALLFFGVVTALSSLLPAESDLAIAGSTLAVAALFNPVRRWVQVWVDRRFNRSRYDTQRVMDRFAGSLQDRVDSQEVVDGWVGVVSETMQPASVAVWVREGR